MSAGGRAMAARSIAKLLEIRATRANERQLEQRACRLNVVN